ncbi:MAG: 2-hydroxyacyl-CoA dehydratase family protein [Dehalococcoidia bacterium]
MDAKKERSVSRFREEIDTYEPVLEVLALEPGEMGHLQIPLLKNMLQKHKRIIECVETGEPFMASQFTNPVEILAAMDIPWYFHVEQQFAAAGTGGSPHTMEDLEAMDKIGVPSDCCTLLRLLLYYQVAGLLPIPTAYLALTEPCDSVAGLHAAFMNHPDWRNVPAYTPDPPYHSDERSINYFAGELKRMVEFITKHMGKTLDMNRLKAAVEETNKGYALWMDYNDIRRAVPAPHSYIMPMSCFYLINTMGAGDPAQTEWYKDLITDAEMRMRENKPEVPDQKIRIFWYDLQPMFFGELVPWLEQEWGGVIAMDMVSYCPYQLVDTSTEDSIFRGLARRAFEDGPMVHQARGLADNVIHDITRIVKDYKIDCVVFPGHMGHKDMQASISLMRETCRDLGVAFLHLGIDICDKRYTSVEDIKGKFSQFFTAMGLG